MKKLVLLVFLIIAGTIGYNVSAQRKLIFKGEKFDVMFKVKPSNQEITDVFYSVEGKWYRFLIEGYDTYKDKSSGFVLQVVDGNEKYYMIDYFKNRDYIIVTDEDENLTWELHRQKDT